MSTRADFTFWRAEDVDLVFTELQTNGTSPQNISGWTITFRAAVTQYGSPSITKSAVLTTPAQGVFTITLASADTSALAQDGTDAIYYYDVRRTDTGSRTELFYGTLTVKDTNTNG